MPRQQPRRLVRAHNRAVLRAHAIPRDISEVLELRGIDVAAEREVHAPNPPSVRQLQREIGGFLREEPSPQPVLADDVAGECLQAVEPVVVARDDQRDRTGVCGERGTRGRQLGLFECAAGRVGPWRRRERVLEGQDEAILVGLGGGVGVGEVAAAAMKGEVEGKGGKERGQHQHVKMKNIRKV